MNRLGILIGVLIGMSGCNGSSTDNVPEIAAAWHNDMPVEWCDLSPSNGKYSNRFEKWEALRADPKARLILWLNERHDWRASIVSYAPGLVFKSSEFNLNCGPEGSTVVVINVNHGSDRWLQYVTDCSKAERAMLGSLAK